MIYIGKTYRIYFLLIHPDTGAPITAPTDDVSVIVYDESGNKTEATATELAYGWFYYDLTPDAEGTWSVRFNYEGVTPYQKGGWADYAIDDMDAKLDTIDTVVDQNYALLAHGTYGLSALKTLIDTKASSSALATVDTNVDTILSRVTGAAALEATLTAMKGDGWTDETLKAIYDLIAALNNITAADVWTAANRELSTPANYKADVSALALEATLTAIKGAGWTDENIKEIVDHLENGTYGLAAIEALVDDLETRLTAARAGYLDELAAANIPADIDIVKADTPYIQDQALSSPIAYSLAEILYVSATEKLKNFLAKTGGTEVPAGKSLVDLIGIPTVSLKDDLDDIKGSGFATGTDDLKTIRTNAQNAYNDADSGYTNITGTGFVADTHSLKNIKDDQDKKVSTVTFWSDLAAVIDLTQALSDDALPDVVISGIPSGATLLRVVAILKCRAIENTSASGANAINGATQKIRVKKSTGTWGVDDIAAIDLADNQWTVAASTREGGDVLIGDNDVKGEVDGDATYNLRFEDSIVDYDNLRLNDVQVGLQVTFY